MNRNDQWVGGAVLIAIGAALLLGQYVGDAGRFILLGLGLVLLLLFVVSRNPGALIGGGIVTGLGVGVLLATELQDEAAGAAVLLGLGGGFVGVWIIGSLLRMDETRIWPLIPGAIMITIGVALLAGTEYLEALEWLWPVIFIVLGLIVVVGAFIRRGSAGGPPADGGPEGGSPGSPGSPG